MFGPVTLAVHAQPGAVHGRAVDLVLVLLVGTIVMTGGGVSADGAVGHKTSWFWILVLYLVYTVSHVFEILVDLLVVLVLL